MEDEQRLGDESARDQADRLLELAESAFDDKECATAAAALAEAADLYAEAGDRVGRAQALWRLGGARFCLREYDECARNYARAAQAALDAEDVRLRASALWGRADALAQVADWGEVLDSVDDALELMRQYGVRDNYGRSLMLRGRALHHLDSLEGSLEALTEAREVFRDDGVLLGVLEVDDHRVGVLCDARRYDEAIAVASAARGIASAVEDPRLQAYLEQRLGEAVLGGGSLAEAQRHFERARAGYVREEAHRDAAVCDVWIGRCRRRDGDPAGAIEAFQRAAAVFDAVGDRDWLAIAQRAESRAQYASGGYAAALALSSALLAGAVSDPMGRGDRQAQDDLVHAVAAAVQAGSAAAATGLWRQVAPLAGVDDRPESECFRIRAVRHWVDWHFGDRLAAIQGAMVLMDLQSAAEPGLPQAWMLEIVGSAVAEQPEGPGYLARALALYRQLGQWERADAVSEQILEATVPLLQPRQLWFRLTSETDVVEGPNGQQVAGE